MSRSTRTRVSRSRGEEGRACRCVVLSLIVVTNYGVACRTTTVCHADRDVLVGNGTVLHSASPGPLIVHVPCCAVLPRPACPPPPLPPPPRSTRHCLLPSPATRPCLLPGPSRRPGRRRVCLVANGERRRVGGRRFAACMRVCVCVFFIRRRPHRSRRPAAPAADGGGWRRRCRS